MSKRLACCVPFCKRTRGDRKGDPVDQYSEWICGKHYAQVDKKLKTQRRRFRARYGHTERGLWLDSLIWRKIKRQAIERAAGL